VISRFFINRPIFASVLSIVIVVAGLASLRNLAVEQYPQIVPPEIMVTANYPGASAEVIASTVAAPLEQQINGVKDMLYMRSSSANSGQLNLFITFEIGTDPDQATIDVNNRVQAAVPRLPAEVRAQGVTVNKRSSSILQVVTMSSPDGTHDPVFISNYALLYVIDALKRVPGVGEVSLFGAKDYSMRIWMRPDKLAQFNLTPADVANAIKEQNSQFAAGQFGQAPMFNKQDFTYTVTTRGRFAEPEEFENIILRSGPKGDILRLKDVARIELGAQDYGLTVTCNGKAAIAIGVYLQPGANALSTTTGVALKMEELGKRFPAGVSYSLPFDTTKFVEISIHEVIKTFVEAILLVILVVYIFLQNGRATLIPLLAVPVSLIGTFAFMYIFGFSINLLTLFGMVLAIGIVVDDAIVVLENVERIIKTEGLPPKEATIKAMEEVTGPVIAIVLVLCAVFIPVGFMGGLTGVMYKQFAITIAVSVIISGFVALTLTPALCAILLKPNHEESSKFFTKFNLWFENLTLQYTTCVKAILNHTKITTGVIFGIIAITIVLFLKIPSSLVPDEDQGYLFTVPILLPAASLSRTEAVCDEFNARLMKNPAVNQVVSFAGFDLFSFTQKSYTGVSFISLTDWAQRKDPKLDARNLVGTFMGTGADFKDAIVLAFNPPPITGMSTTGGFELYMQNKSGENIKTIAEMSNRLVEAAKKRPELAGLQGTISANVPQYFVELDREKAKALNVPIDVIFSTMQSTFGNMYVNDFTLFGRSYKVSLQSEAPFREKPEDLRYVFVRSLDGKMIPLDSLVKIQRVINADIIERFNGFPSAKIMGKPAPGYSSGQAIEAMQAAADEVLNNDYDIGWVGSAYQEKIAQASGASAFLLGIVMVFLILAAQYERWSLPLAVIATVPFALFGSLLAIWLRSLSNDIYFQIGLITLIGLSAKNAILIVEFAILKRAEGFPLYEAIIEASRLRLRPIIMTSLAFILGCVPLAISSGAGSASRHSIGTGVIGGMLAATFLAVFFVPFFFKMASKLTEKE